MVEYEDECVGCPTEMGCLGFSCQNRHVPHLYCDKCKQEVDDLYDYDDKQICLDCIVKQLKKIEV